MKLLRRGWNAAPVLTRVVIIGCLICLVGDLTFLATGAQYRVLLWFVPIGSLLLLVEFGYRCWEMTQYPLARRRQARRQLDAGNDETPPASTL